MMMAACQNKQANGFIFYFLLFFLKHKHHHVRQQQHQKWQQARDVSDDCRQRSSRYCEGFCSIVGRNSVNIDNTAAAATIVDGLTFGTTVAETI
jgi:hypothetical protein